MKKRFLYMSFYFLMISCLSENKSWTIERDAIIYFGNEKVGFLSKLGHSVSNVGF
jgi:hypothetical protein